MHASRIKHVNILSVRWVPLEAAPAVAVTVVPRCLHAIQIRFTAQTIAETIYQNPLAVAR